MADWTDKRPMSPHLQVWRWHITMASSIFHRATGIALYAGAFLVAGWLLAVASGPEAYDVYRDVSGSIFGQLVLFGFTVAVLYHLGNGIRHLFWDAGMGYGVATARMTAWLVFAVAILGAIAIWVAAGLVRI